MSTPFVPLPDFGPQKAWVGLGVASVFSGLTAALAFTADGSPLSIGLTVAAAVLTPLATALGVYVTPNKAK